MSASAKSIMVYLSGADSPGWSRTKGRKMVVVVVIVFFFVIPIFARIPSLNYRTDIYAVFTAGRFHGGDVNKLSCRF